MSDPLADPYSIGGVEMATRAFAAGAAVVLLAAPALAEKLPDWNIASICREDSAPGQCSLFEGRARNAISSSWDLLPPEVRSACLEATRSPLDHSWRTLADCIEGEVLRAKSRRAIATRSTPAEPEPLAPPAPAAPAESAPETPASLDGAASPPSEPTEANAPPTPADAAKQ